MRESIRDIFKKFKKDVDAQALGDAWRAAHPEKEEKPVKSSENEIELTPGPDLELTEKEQNKPSHIPVNEVEFDQSQLENYEYDGITKKGEEDFELDLGDGEIPELDKKDLPI